MKRIKASAILVAVVGLSMCAHSAVGDKVSKDISSKDNSAKNSSVKTIKPIPQRYASAKTKGTPDFRRHVVPLFGKLGCNGRACHGSFQGQGGFRLSLFGYNFQLDHKSLRSGDEPRVNLKSPALSLMLRKPTLTEEHEGGKRFAVDSWQYRVLHRWIQSGAKGVSPKDADLIRLDVTPAEVVFSKSGDKTQLSVVAIWSDGSTEDVTPLTRFQTNDDQIAKIDSHGMVTANAAGDTHVVVFYDKGVVPVPVLMPVSDSVGPRYPDVKTPTQIDVLVVNKLRKLGIVASDICTDAEFLRRASLDITGTLPPSKEVKEFLADTSADKRARKIDELLERPAYAAWWSTRLCDITGNNTDALNNVTPVRGKASSDWYEWIERRVRKNMPYDELVAGIVLANGREEGESFTEYSKTMSALYAPGSKGSYADRETLPHYWARRTVRQPKDKALSFAYTFLGIRIECAQCHKHPFDRWTQDDYRSFTNFFNRVRFGKSPASNKEYKALMAELDVGKARGGQLRRKLAALLKQGETVPFQEVFVVKPRPKQKQRRANKQNKADGKKKAAKKNAKKTNAKQKKKKSKKKKRRKQPAAPKKARLLGGDVVDLTKLDDPRVPLMEWLRSENNPYFARAFVNRVWSGYFNRGIVEPADDLSLANPPSNRPLLDYLAAEFVRHNYDMKWLHREIANSSTYQRSWKPNETNRLDERNFSRAVPRRLPAEVAYDAVVQATASDATVRVMQKKMRGRAIAIPGAGRRSRKGAGYALTIFGKSTRASNCDCDRSGEPSLLQTVFLRNDREVLRLIEREGSGWLAQIDRELTGRKKVVNKKAGGKKGRGKKAGKKKKKANKKNKVKNKKADIKPPTGNKEKKNKKAGNNVRKNAKKKKQKKANPNKPANKPKQPKRAQVVVRIQKQIANLETRLTNLKKQRVQTQKRLGALRKRLKQVKSQMNKAGGPAGKRFASKPVKIPAKRAAQLVREAYLRTLSRYPSDDEAKRAVAFVADTPDGINGLRGLLWALMNTKEFIVNH